MIHNKPRQSLLCAISSTVFLPSWEESVLLQTHMLRLSHHRLVAQQHHPVVAAKQGPSMFDALRSLGSRCLRSARRRGHGAAVAGVTAGSKGMARAPRSGRLLAEVPAFDEQTSNQYAVH